MATDCIIELDLARDLPKVRKAYGRLVKRLGECSYSAPCAVGAMMTPAQRRKLAVRGMDGAGIDTLVDRHIVCVPKDQTADFLLLQESFDRRDREAFDAILADCEQRYLAVPA